MIEGFVVWGDELVLNCGHFYEIVVIALWKIQKYENCKISKIHV